MSGVDKPVAALLGLAVLALGLLGLRIRMLTVRLQRAARLQCAMATATNLILEARADTASACLAGALAVVGGAVDADHAYVVGATLPATTMPISGRAPVFHGRPAGRRRSAGVFRDSRLPGRPDLARPDTGGSVNRSVATSVRRDRDGVEMPAPASWRVRRRRAVLRLHDPSCSVVAPGSLDTLRAIGGLFAAALERRSVSVRHGAMETALRQAQRLEAVSTFASGVAHNINNVLNVMVGHAVIAAEVLPPGSRATRQIELLVQAGERAREITGQILEFGRRGRWTRRPNPVDAVVAESLEQLRSSMAERIAIRFEGSTGGAFVGGEPAQLQQVIFNLIRNAAQATEPGAVVGLRTAIVGVTGPRHLSHGTLRPGPYVCLTVVDAGCGMDEETRARIFEPFFTTRPAGTDWASPRRSNSWTSRAAPSTCAARWVRAAPSRLGSRS